MLRQKVPEMAPFDGTQLPHKHILADIVKGKVQLPDFQRGQCRVRAEMSFDRAAIKPAGWVRRGVTSLGYDDEQQRRHRV